MNTAAPHRDARNARSGACQIAGAGPIVSRRSPVDRLNGLYTAEDLGDVDYTRDLGDPGAFPYTRGIHPIGYRGKLWTMRQSRGLACLRTPTSAT